MKKKYFQEIFCVKNADLVLILNDITGEHFVKRLGVKADRIRKIINGVNTRQYSPLDEEELLKHKRAEGLEQKKVIFQVGSVCDRKNQLGSLEMLKDYLRSHQDVVYMYAGGIIDEDYQRSITEYAKQNGISHQVKYVGEVSPGEKLNIYYNIADCCIFTSLLESFGLVIIEAISSGTPVVVGNNMMFDIKGGYSIYNSKEEFVLEVDNILCSGQKLHNDIDDIIGAYSWDSVARGHAELFTTAK